MAYPPYDENPATGDRPQAFAAKSKEWQETLRNAHYGATPPANPVNGDRWINDQGQFFYYYNSTWNHVADATALGARDHGGFQAINFVLEQTAPSAELGRTGYDTGPNRPWYGNGTATAYDGGWPTDGSGLIRLPCDLNVASLGDPAVGVVNTRHGGWLFNTTGQRLNVIAQEPVPAGWTGGHDCAVEIEYLLAAAETANDQPDFGGDFRMLASGKDVNTTGSPATTSTENIGSDVGANTLHRATCVLPRGDGNNPTAAGATMSLELKAAVGAGAGQIASLVVTRASLLVPVYSARRA